MVCIELVLHMVPHVYETPSPDRSRPWAARAIPLKLRATRNWLESKPVTDAVKRLVPVAGAQGPYAADIVQSVRFDPLADAYNVHVRFFTAAGDSNDEDDEKSARAATGGRLLDFLGRFRTHMEGPVVYWIPSRSAGFRSFDMAHPSMKLAYRSVSTPYFVPPLIEADA